MTLLEIMIPLSLVIVLSLILAYRLISARAQSEDKTAIEIEGQPLHPYEQALLTHKEPEPSIYPTSTLQSDKMAGLCGCNNYPCPYHSQIEGY